MLITTGNLFVFMTDSDLLKEKKMFLGNSLADFPNVQCGQISLAFGQ